MSPSTMKKEKKPSARDGQLPPFSIVKEQLWGHWWKEERKKG